MPLFDMTIHVGDVMTTAAVTGVGLGLRMMYKLINKAVTRHDQALDDIDDHAIVINQHTGLLVKSGLVPDGMGIGRVEERRKTPRIYTSTL